MSSGIGYNSYTFSYFNRVSDVRNRIIWENEDMPKYEK
jgi:hypothetical protein